MNSPIRTTIKQIKDNSVMDEDEAVEALMTFASPQRTPRTTFFEIFSPKLLKSPSARLEEEQFPLLFEPALQSTDIFGSRSKRERGHLIAKNGHPWLVDHPFGLFEEEETVKDLDLKWLNFGISKALKLLVKKKDEMPKVAAGYSNFINEQLYVTRKFGDVDYVFISNSSKDISPQLFFHIAADFMLDVTSSHFSTSHDWLFKQININYISENKDTPLYTSRRQIEIHENEETAVFVPKFGYMNKPIPEAPTFPPLIVKTVKAFSKMPKVVRVKAEVKLDEMEMPDEMVFVIKEEELPKFEKQKLEMKLEIIEKLPKEEPMLEKEELMLMPKAVQIKSEFAALVQPIEMAPAPVMESEVKEIPYIVLNCRLNAIKTAYSKGSEEWNESLYGKIWTCAFDQIFPYNSKDTVSDKGKQFLNKLTSQPEGTNAGNRCWEYKQVQLMEHSNKLIFSNGLIGSGLEMHAVLVICNMSILSAVNLQSNCSPHPEECAVIPKIAARGDNKNYDVVENKKKGKDAIVMHERQCEEYISIIRESASDSAMLIIKPTLPFSLERTLSTVEAMDVIRNLISKCDFSVLTDSPFDSENAGQMVMTQVARFVALHASLVSKGPTHGMRVGAFSGMCVAMGGPSFDGYFDEVKAQMARVASSAVLRHAFSCTPLDHSLFPPMPINTPASFKKSKVSASSDSVVSSSIEVPKKARKLKSYAEGAGAGAGASSDSVSGGAGDMPMTLGQIQAQLLKQRELIIGEVFGGFAKEKKRKAVKQIVPEKKRKVVRDVYDDEADGADDDIVDESAVVDEEVEYVPKATTARQIGQLLSESSRLVDASIFSIDAHIASVVSKSRAMEDAQSAMLEQSSSADFCKLAQIRFDAAQSARDEISGSGDGWAVEGSEEFRLEQEVSRLGTALEAAKKSFASSCLKTEKMVAAVALSTQVEAEMLAEAKKCAFAATQNIMLIFKQRSCNSAEVIKIFGSTLSSSFLLHFSLLTLAQTGVELDEISRSTLDSSASFDKFNIYVQ
jgi:hypothetical protein